MISSDNHLINKCDTILDSRMYFLTHRDKDIHCMYYKYNISFARNFFWKMAELSEAKSAKRIFASKNLKILIFDEKLCAYSFALQSPF